MEIKSKNSGSARTSSKKEKKILLRQSKKKKKKNGFCGQGKHTKSVVSLLRQIAAMTPSIRAILLDDGNDSFCESTQSTLVEDNNQESRARKWRKTRRARGEETNNKGYNTNLNLPKLILPQRIIPRLI